MLGFELGIYARSGRRFMASIKPISMNILNDSVYSKRANWIDEFGQTHHSILDCDFAIMINGNWINLLAIRYSYLKCKNGDFGHGSNWSPMIVLRKRYNTNDFMDSRLDFSGFPRPFSQKICRNPFKANFSTRNYRIALIFRSIGRCSLSREISVTGNIVGPAMAASPLSM